jgi:hypothetical protein
VASERTLRAVFWTAVLTTWLAGAAVPASARSLKRAIPDLFGGTLATTIDPSAQQDLQQVLVAERFSDLSASLAVARSQAPVPSASGAFRFAWDPELDTFVRSSQSLGSLLAERALTLGKNTFTIGLSYSHIDFDTLDGDNLRRVRTTQPALSDSFLDRLPASDRAMFADDILLTQLNLEFSFDLIYLTAAYGVTDNVDVSLALSINRAEMRGRATAMTLNPNDDPDQVVFAADQKGVISNASLCDPAFSCAVDGFDESAFGTGDLFLRSKWHFANTRFADFATVGVLTLPTGNADDFLGFHDVTFTPWLVVSKPFDRVEPHINLGYSIRSGKDVSQAQWIVGADFRATNWLTLAVDFLGYHDDNRDGINDDIFQSALGFKLNPFGEAVVGGSFQLPLNRDGLRADVIYTVQLEYTF